MDAQRRGDRPWKVQMSRRGRQPDLFSSPGSTRTVDARNVPAGEWLGPGTEPHDYHPDTMAMGDCSVCGHTYDAHLRPHEDEPSPAPVR